MSVPTKGWVMLHQNWFRRLVVQLVVPNIYR